MSGDAAGSDLELLLSSAIFARASGACLLLGKVTKKCSNNAAALESLMLSQKASSGPSVGGETSQPKGEVGAIQAEA